jgi:hypothetical protein
MLKIVLNDLWQNSFSCINFPPVKLLTETQNVKNYLCITRDTLSQQNGVSAQQLLCFPLLFLTVSLSRQVSKIRNFYDLKAFV